MFEKPLDKYESWYQTEINGRDFSYKKKACVRLIESLKKKIDPLGSLFKSDKQKFLYNLQKEIYPYIKYLYRADEDYLFFAVLGTIYARKIFEAFASKRRDYYKKIFLEALMQSPFFTYYEKKKLYKEI